MPKQLITLLICTILVGEIDVKPSRADETTPDNLNKSDGLYYEKSASSARQLRDEGGPPTLLGEKTNIKILRARVYSEDNVNANFEVALDTTDFPYTPAAAHDKPIALRVGDRCYGQYGGGGSDGIGNVMWFKIHNGKDAEAVAAGLHVPSILRAPPAYKLQAQFIPQKPAYTTNEPVFVTFRLKNLDDRTVIFMRGGHQRGPRDNQYGFTAMLAGAGIPDTGNPCNHGGLAVSKSLRPGEVFEDYVDLADWFAFRKPGTYSIHGWYILPLLRAELGPDAAGPSNTMWDDHASADFEVDVK